MDSLSPDVTLQPGSQPPAIGAALGPKVDVCAKCQRGPHPDHPNRYACGHQRQDGDWRAFTGGIRAEGEGESLDDIPIDPNIILRDQVQALLVSLNREFRAVERVLLNPLTKEKQRDKAHERLQAFARQTAELVKLAPPGFSEIEPLRIELTHGMDRMKRHLVRLLPHAVVNVLMTMDEDREEPLTDAQFFEALRDAGVNLPVEISLSTEAPRPVETPIPAEPVVSIEDELIPDATALVGDHEAQSAEERYASQMPRLTLLDCERLVATGWSQMELCTRAWHWRSPEDVAAGRTCACGDPKAPPKVEPVPARVGFSFDW